MRTPKKISENFKHLNESAFQVFDIYKKTSGLMDRANYAVGKKTAYISTQSSTLNYKI